MSASWHRRFADHWPLEPGDGSLLILSTFLGVFWAYVALALVLEFGVDPALGIDSVGDSVRIPILLPWFVHVLVRWRCTGSAMSRTTGALCY